MASDDILKFRAGDLHTKVLEHINDNDLTVSQFLRDAVEAKLAHDCDSCGECDVCGLDRLALDQADEPPTATIMGYGRFDTTTNPEVQALIDRAKELLATGAVGTSVATDLDPDDLPTDPEAVTEDHIMSAHQRIRHNAIVDTPAFSGAFLELDTDGNSFSGPMVFEGAITGDIRAIGPVGSFNLDDSLLPIPVIFDLHEGDHTGVTVGHIDRWERVDGIVGKTQAPIAASVGSYPAWLFDQPQPGPMTISEPDANGFRRYSGTIAPAGVCHKGMGGCYTYKGASLDYFHSGASIPLDNGQMVRVGPLMFGDMHADGQEMDYATALTRTNEDARTVAAMGRVFAHPAGALFSGVLMPDVDVMRVQACAPSVELWPDHRGRLELKTALLVPRPAFPVAASLGAGVQLAEPAQTFVELDPEPTPTVEERLAKLESTIAELYATHLAAQL